ncbi:hypothetical protein PENTCL1PPCAC_12363 [Pristionchus entomophagus]|uniref:Uncharacterized protein n=1 Tax=Pristionchus entomophagus TaxID=358040 RepID=A0AAV5T7R8_9BILA|nr:hypothetical protein PENTCL1PPCAC_12363 [Pristionchus entomophagus]
MSYSGRNYSRCPCNSRESLLVDRKILGPRREKIATLVYSVNPLQCDVHSVAILRASRAREGRECSFVISGSSSDTL